MKIQEIIIEQQQLDELNVGQGIGKAVGGVAKGIGAVAGGIAGIPNAVKKGYQAGKAAVGGSDTTQPATGTAPLGAVQGAVQSNAPVNNPVAIRDQIRQYQAAISQLQQQLSAPAADNQEQDTEEPAQTPSNSNVRPFVRTNQPQSTTPQSTTTPANQTTTPADAAPQSPEEIRKAKQADAAGTAQQDMAANPSPTQATPTTPQTPEQIRQAKQAAATQTAQDQMGPPGQPVAQLTTAPTPSGLGDAGNIRPGAPQPDPKAQQAALKARLQGQRAAGTSTATQTGTGFKGSRVGVPVQKLVGTNSDGSPKFATVREGKVYSRFFRSMI
jgi:hypothetical protein